MKPLPENMEEILEFLKAQCATQSVYNRLMTFVAIALYGSREAFEHRPPGEVKATMNCSVVQTPCTDGSRLAEGYQFVVVPDSLGDFDTVIRSNLDRCVRFLEVEDDKIINVAKVQMLHS